MAARRQLFSNPTLYPFFDHLSHSLLFRQDGPSNLRHRRYRQLSVGTIRCRRGPVAPPYPADKAFLS